MDSLTLAIAIAGITSVFGAILGILFVFARDEGDRLAEENTQLLAALEAKRKDADTLSEQLDWSRNAARLGEMTGKELSAKIADFKKRGYIRNVYGTLQRYADWFENGDKKPKPKRKEKKRDEQKPLTRAEACLAILNEAKDAGFPWAESAIEQFDEKWANLPTPPFGYGLNRAIFEFANAHCTQEGYSYWFHLSESEEVKSFRPNTKWPE